MKCQDIFRRISEYLDEELEDFLKEGITEHLKYCSRCTALLNTLEKTIDLSRNWGRKSYRPPRQVIRRVYYQLQVRYVHRTKRK
jgi:predicted anti-sigma-YlaC factor YlaD